MNPNTRNCPFWVAAGRPVNCSVCRGRKKGSCPVGQMDALEQRFDREYEKSLDNKAELWYKTGDGKRKE